VVSAPTVGNSSYGPDMPDEDINRLYGSLPSAIEGGTDRKASRRGGGVVGWYIRPDGMPTRADCGGQARVDYEDKGFKFMREWGIFPDSPVMRDGVVVARIEPKYEQLERLVREGIVPEDYLLRCYEPTPERAEGGASWRDGCPCGEKGFASKFLFDIHQRRCTTIRPAAAPPPDPELVCLECGNVAKSRQGRMTHMRLVHPEKYEEVRAALAAAEGESDA
jgi:hypothetical protein